MTKTPIKYSAAEVIMDRSCDVNDKVWVKIANKEKEPAQDRTHLSKNVVHFIWDYNYATAFILVVLLGIKYGLIDINF